MNFSNLFKELKRRLRMKKRWLSLGAFMLLAGASAALIWLLGGTSGESSNRTAVETMGQATINKTVSTDGAEPSAEEAITRIKERKSKLQVVFTTRYICGEETRRLGRMTSAEIMSLLHEHPDAKVSLGSNDEVSVTEVVDDLSSACKDHAYFGLDKNGNLSLFNGLPGEDQVIRTFFQLNVEHMKSSLPEDTVNQLYSGIRVTDMADYNSILSTFSEYALEEAAPVTNPRQ